MHTHKANSPDKQISLLIFLANPARNINKNFATISHTTRGGLYLAVGEEVVPQGLRAALRADAVLRALAGAAGASRGDGGRGVVMMKLEFEKNVELKTAIGKKW